MVIMPGGAAYDSAGERCQVEAEVGPIVSAAAQDRIVSDINAGAPNSACPFPDKSFSQ